MHHEAHSANMVHAAKISKIRRATLTRLRSPMRFLKPVGLFGPLRLRGTCAAIGLRMADVAYRPYRAGEVHEDHLAYNVHHLFTAYNP
eukprot:4793260-Pyramimonas_sp.AAC.1